MSILPPAVSHVVKFACSVTETAAGTIVGMGVTKGINSLSGTSLGIFSYLQGLGVQANELQEDAEMKKNDDKSSSSESLGSQIVKRAQKIVIEEVSDMAKTAITVGLSAAAFILSEKFGGIYAQEYLFADEGLSATVATKDINPLQLLGGWVINTPAEAAMGMAALKSLQSGIGVLLACTSWYQAQGIAANEKKEKVADENKVSAKLGNRALKTMNQEFFSCVKASAIFFAALGVHYIGTRAGGESVQMSALKMYRNW